MSNLQRPFFTISRPALIESMMFQDATSKDSGHKEVICRTFFFLILPTQSCFPSPTPPPFEGDYSLLLVGPTPDLGEA